MEIALNILLLLPKIILKLVLFIVAGTLRTILFGVQVVAGLFALPFHIIGSATSLGALYMFIATLKSGTAAFDSTGKYIGQVVLFFLMICFGGLIVSLPSVIDELDVVPEFLYELGCDIPLWS